VVVEIRVPRSLISIAVAELVDVDVGIEQTDPDPRRRLRARHETVVTTQIMTVELRLARCGDQNQDQGCKRSLHFGGSYGSSAPVGIGGYSFSDLTCSSSCGNAALGTQVCGKRTLSRSWGSFIRL